MWLLMTILFAFIYAVLVVLGRGFLHTGSFTFYLVLSFVMMFIQYLIGPKIVE